VPGPVLPAPEPAVVSFHCTVCEPPLRVKLYTPAVSQVRSPLVLVIVRLGFVPAAAKEKFPLLNGVVWSTPVAVTTPNVGKLLAVVQLIVAV
jgi:hypothetical protein